MRVRVCACVCVWKRGASNLCLELSSGMLRMCVINLSRFFFCWPLFLSLLRCLASASLSIYTVLVILTACYYAVASLSALTLLYKYQVIGWYQWVVAAWFERLPTGWNVSVWTFSSRLLKKDEVIAAFLRARQLLLANWTNKSAPTLAGSLDFVWVPFWRSSFTWWPILARGTVHRKHAHFGRLTTDFQVRSMTDTQQKHQQLLTSVDGTMMRALGTELLLPYTLLLYSNCLFDTSINTVSGFVVLFLLARSPWFSKDPSEERPNSAPTRGRNKKRVQTSRRDETGACWLVKRQSTNLFK